MGIMPKSKSGNTNFWVFLLVWMG